MGSSCEENGKPLDPTVGGLVWVRRRNGAWWPGRILGSDELPESCLLTPRSGTPVKLLGREDASVDWYNFEKSKRIKAFRCGEYDECIEKAKNAASMSYKRTVKYARRDDAILHALEIESSQSSKHCPDTTSPELSRSAASADHDPNDSSNSEQSDEETENISDKVSSLEHISISPQEYSTEDDAMEGSKKRMRGLEDIGTAGAVSSFKRRRTQVAHVHDYLKKRNRRRMLSKVLKSSTMITVPVRCEQLMSTNGSFLNNELVTSFSDSNGDITNNATNGKQKEKEISSIDELIENYDSSGMLFDVPLIGDEKQTAGSSSRLLYPGYAGAVAHAGQSSLVETLSLGPNETNESGSISSGDAVGITNYTSQQIEENGTSRWQHKGKRKSRNKRRALQKFAYTNALANSSTQVNIEETVDVMAPQRLTPYRQSHFTVNPKYEPSELAYNINELGSLYDVNVEVKVGHFPQNVPYISLMSKLTGQPITGHSLEVDVMNDSECFSSSPELDSVNGVNGNIHMVPEAFKNSKRNNGASSNKKIRSLSSLTGSNRPSETGMVTKPILACVPLKVVFSRINAALGINSKR
ncbi:uncharacterized protein At1g51745-like [Rutidosis leptorrhynchoides]|uniref:uncharacterized protein At1g51745-like n=1 Tax=Rutidosis leptorrhynchoides TaxID=125765 RepID=UPI003A99F927